MLHVFMCSCLFVFSLFFIVFPGFCRSGQVSDGPKLAWMGRKVAWMGSKVAWTGPKVDLDRAQSGPGQYSRPELSANQRKSAEINGNQRKSAETSGAQPEHESTQSRKLSSWSAM